MAEPGVVETAEVTQAGQNLKEDGCSGWGCGSNSPAIDASIFHELNLRGLPNKQGFALANDAVITNRATHVDAHYTLRVTNAEILLLDPATQATARRGEYVVDARFRVTNARQSYDVKIAAVHKTQMWVQGSGYTYQLQWFSAADMRWVDVCPREQNQTVEMVVFEGDRISAETKVDYGIDKDWFNLGCKTHTLGKLHMSGHTMAADAILGQTTSLDERTAVLKMYSADYCGTGAPYTVAGTPLHWRDRIYNDVFVIGDWLEARWSARGATCISQARLDNWPSTAYPHVLDTLSAACAIPVCDTTATTTGLESFNTYQY